MPQSPPPDLASWLPWLRRPQLRASDEEREEVVAELSEQHIQGRLSAEELGERTQLAYRAQTQGDLDRLTRDLPARRGAPLVLPRELPGPRWSGGPFPRAAFVGFWPRVAALAADLVFLGLVIEAIQSPMDGLGVGWATGLLAPVYFVVLWATLGRTLGLGLLGAKVVRQEDGGRLGFRRSLLRLVGYLVDAATLGLGFAWAGVDRRKQAWHDKMASSYVIRRLR